MIERATPSGRAASGAGGECASGRFARALGPCQDPPFAGGLVGVEHEYRVLRPDGTPEDFRRLIHSLAIDGRRLDPGDTNAYRLTSGLALTADGAEAEIATPPVAFGPGFASEAAAQALEGERRLRSLLPPGLRLEGYSTHVNVSVPPGDGDGLARRYALTFGPAFAALADRPESLGIYVRPRPGRLELCCDFVDADRLAIVVAFAAGTVRACAEADSGRGMPVPQPLSATLLAGTERHGYRLHRRAAFGFDVYAAGWEAVLPLQAGGATTLGRLLADSWRIVERRLGPNLDLATRRAGRFAVGGRTAPGFEGRQGAPGPGSGAWSAAVWRPGPRDHSRPAFSVEPVISTWDFTVFRLDGSRQGFAAVPRPALEAFEQRLLAGSLDAVIEDFLGEPPGDRVLAQHSDTRLPGLYDAVIDDRIALLAPEHPLTPEPSSLDPRPGKQAALQRPGKLPPARPTVEAASIAPRPYKRPAPPRAENPPSTGLIGEGAWSGHPSSPSDPPVRRSALPAAQAGADPTRPNANGRPAWLVGAAIAGALAIGAIVALVLADGDGGGSDVPGIPTAGPTGTAAAPTPTVRTSETASAGTGTASIPAGPTTTPAVQGTATGTAVATPGAAGTSTPTPSGTTRPAETPPPTPTARPTESPTVRPTETPRPTATVRPTETPHATATPTRIVEPTPNITPTPPRPGCTPSPGVICPPADSPTT